MENEQQAEVIEQAEPRLFEILGGRKMTLAWVAILLGTAVEIATERGMSATFASFLAGIIASFSAANVLITHKAISQDGSEKVSATSDSRVPLIINDIQTLGNAVQTIKADLEAAKTSVGSDMQTMAQALENNRKVVAALAKVRS